MMAPSYEVVMLGYCRYVIVVVLFSLGAVLVYFPPLLPIVPGGENMKLSLPGRCWLCVRKGQGYQEG